MNEESVLSLLTTTFSGVNTEEVDDANKQLDSLGFNNDFLVLLFSIILNENFAEQIKFSAIIRLIRIVKTNWIDENMSDEIRKLFYNAILQILPQFFNSKKSLFKMALKLLQTIICKQYLIDKLESILNLSDSLIENQNENPNSVFLFAIIHQTISKEIILYSTEEIVQQMIAHFVQVLSNIFVENDDTNIMIIIVKTISKYIQRNHIFFQYLNENTINKIILLCDSYDEQFNKKLLYSIINFISIIFNDHKIEEINLHFAEFYFRIFQIEPSYKTAKLLKSIMTNETTYANFIEPNIDEILNYIYSQFFSITEAEKNYIETNIQSFFSSFQTDIFGDCDERTLLYLTLTHVSRKEMFSHSLLEFVTNILSSSDINEETSFSILFMLSSAIPFLTPYTENVFQIIAECLSTESPLVISGALICCSKLYNYNCPIELYGAIFEAITNDSLLVKNYAIEAIQELFMNPPQDNDLNNMIKETFSGNIEEIISLIFQSANELNDPQLKLSVIYLLQFFGDDFLPSNIELCVELYLLYTSSTDILGTYDSILITITNIIKNAEINENSIIEAFLPSILESFEEIHDSSISKIVILLSNMVYFSLQEIDFSIFYPHIISLLQQVPNLIEQCSFFLNNLFIKQPNFLMENYEDIYGFLFSLYEREVTCSCCTENIGYYLYLFSVLFYINKESDLIPVIELLDQETFEMLFHVHNKGASLFFTIAFERTEGAFLTKFDSENLFELYEMKASNNEIIHFIHNCSSFVNEKILNDLQNSLSHYDDIGEEDLVVYLIPLFE